MKLSQACVARAVMGAATVAILCRCSAAAPSSTGGFMPLAASYLVRQGTLIERKLSWMRPTAKEMDLLYVSDEGTNNVYVYSWPQAHLVGVISGIAYPQGECVDRAGNIYVTALGTSGTSYVVEYAHGGTKPIARLNDEGYDASGCSVDPTTGNLAVTNLESRTLGGGNLIIYKKARQAYTTYSGGGVGYFFFCGYDPKGNLYVDGGKDFNPFDGFAFAELPAGARALVSVTLNQNIDYPGAVQWSGRYIAVGDTDDDVIYRFSTRGTNGYQNGSTILDGGSYVLQFWIQGRSVVGPNAGTANVMIWNYPAGGDAIRTLTGFTDPVGAVVSLHR
jgi:hypothetical protein